MLIDTSQEDPRTLTTASLSGEYTTEAPITEAPAHITPHNYHHPTALENYLGPEYNYYDYLLGLWDGNS
jgi:hypothetical protein